MDSKQEYISFCNKHDWVPLFHQPFWWDCATKNWDVQKIKVDTSMAYLPYTFEKKMGFIFSRNPHLTPYSGLLFSSLDYTISQKKTLFEKCKVFLSQFALSEYDCNPTFISNNKNFSEKHKRTYLLDINKTEEDIYSNFKSSLRRQLKKAEKLLTVSEAKETETFYSIYRESLDKQKGATIIPKETVEKIWNLCNEKSLGKIYFAKDEEENVHAAIFNVYDHQHSYYLLGGSNQAYLGSGAMGLLLWHCIKEAKTNGKTTFDFEGSEVPGVARFFSTFGGKSVEYPVLAAKTNSKLKALLKLKKAIGK